ncbi:MAG TPA: class I SAM-dependent methyltransferase [bacterium]|nr:class I SAM-dependent methyltransferase [bacterium]
MPDPHAVVGFYDRFGARQDHQGWYEDPALEQLITLGRLADAHAVCEFGCGTGRLAAWLLRSVLPADARYLGVDASASMIALATERVEPWTGRAEVHRTTGALRVPAEIATWDRFLSTYVLDLLSEDDILALLEEAARVLRPGGLLCVASLTHGRGALTGLVSRLWSVLYALHWRLVGGCRPLVLAPLLPPHRWRVLHDEAVSAWGITSEVLVAERLG